MPDFTATRPHVYVSGAIIFASNHNNNETTLYNAHNSAFNASTGHTHTGTTGDGPKLSLSSLSLNELPPVGSIIAFYDFGGSLTFDATKWAYCNGAAATFTGIGSQTTPDLSGRYLVGFGTDGGGDNDSAAWSVTPVGNASHEVNLQHSHTVDAHTHTGPSHTHDMANHTHTGPSHTHTMTHTHSIDPPSTTSTSSGSHSHTVNSHTHTGPLHNHDNGSLAALIYMNNPSTGTSDGIYMLSASTVSWNADTRDDAGGAQATFPTGLTTGAAIRGSTGDEGNGATGSASPGTDSQGSHTHDVDIAAFTSGAASSSNTGADGTGATGVPSTNTTSASGTGATGSATPGTDSQLSTTQSIQPRSVSVRFIIRIA